MIKLAQKELMSLDYQMLMCLIKNFGLKPMKTELSL